MGVVRLIAKTSRFNFTNGQDPHNQLNFGKMMCNLQFEIKNVLNLFILVYFKTGGLNSLCQGLATA